MNDFTEHFFTAGDGVRTYYRRYEPDAASGKAPVVCLHGLTRNSRDFEEIAPRIAAKGRRVIAVDVRGRGRSDRAPDPSTYYPGVYVKDVLGLLDAEGIDRVVSIGTSMGGLMTMILAAERPGFLRGVALNDIGPELAPEGMARIQGYVGGASSFSSWSEAAEAVRAINGVAFPNETGEAFWIAFAKRICRETETGEIVLDYDPAIAKPVQEGDAAPPDLWPLFDAMADAPLLLIRGAITDLLSEDTVAEMQRRRPDMERVDVPEVGHAPLLTEPEAWSAIAAFLERVD
ncbi:alpha/beta hydrolase [Marinicauda salina]|uniref:Alpha/beta hydrolase n=1 Tax=Marinicauda salina TaxID=2135793 RepID=A0A2U2BV64_9PROT|nr:alpha/beta hydrolase [Marinicauda salina]PWE17921.1 alpha/beta hydrolase [Marinicauda salina]